MRTPITTAFGISLLMMATATPAGSPSDPFPLAAPAEQHAPQARLLVRMGERHVWAVPGTPPQIRQTWRNTRGPGWRVQSLSAPGQVQWQVRAQDAQGQCWQVQAKPVVDWEHELSLVIVQPCPRPVRLGP